MEINKSLPVMITGATGYVAGPVAEKFLREGFTLHAAVRNPENTEKLKYLNALAEKLPGSIKYFKADLLEKGSYEESMQGCQVVIHTASPFIQKVEDPQRDLIDPAVEGTRNVLESVNKTKSVERVVLTSSVAAIYGDAVDIEQTENKTLTENDWNTSSKLDHQPYSYSKTLAEKEAWKINKKQDRWDLVVVNPSLVLGPGIRPGGSSESFNIFRQLADGSMKFGAPDFRLGAVDVRDLALAHYNAAVFPDAEGRHIVSNQTVNFLTLADMLREKYPQYPLPKRTLPKFLVWLMAPAVGFTRKMISRNIGYPWRADNSKSKEKLKVSYRPMQETVIDFFEQLQSSGAFNTKTSSRN